MVRRVARRSPVSAARRPDARRHGLADTGEVVGEIEAQRHRDRNADQLAAAAVMAGCKPEYGRLLRSLSELLVDPAFNLSGVEVTTGGVAVLVIVGGPIVEQLGFEHEANAIGGANVRANGTVGRYAQMVRLFCGRGGGVLPTHGTMGHPGRLSFSSPSTPRPGGRRSTRRRGCPPTASAVSIMAAEGPNSVNNHYGAPPEQILDTIADCIGHYGATNYYWHFGTSVVVVGPAHTDTIAAPYTRDEARHHLFERRSARPTSSPSRPHADGATGEEQGRATARCARHSIRSRRSTCSRVGAPGGRFSAVVPGWVGNYHVMSKTVDETIRGSHVRDDASLRRAGRPDSPTTHGPVHGATVRPEVDQVVLFDNGKPNSMAILRRTQALLRARGVDVKEEIRSKPFAGVPVDSQRSACWPRSAVCSSAASTTEAVARRAVRSTPCSCSGSAWPRSPCSPSRSGRGEGRCWPSRRPTDRSRSSSSNTRCRTSTPAEIDRRAQQLADAAQRLLAGGEPE